MTGKNKPDKEDFVDIFEEVYNHHLDRVYRFIHSIVHHETAAEDITAEVFLRLWKKRNTLLEYENITGLLFKISRDLSINHLKSLAKNQQKKEEFIRHYYGLNSFIDESLLRELQLTTLERAIDQLPDKCREVVKMKFLLGKSLKEIASELHISVNTVQNHLTRGKFLIRELIQTDETLLILVMTIPWVV